MKQERTERLRKNKETNAVREMKEIFESFEYMIYEKAEALDYIIACMTREATTCGVPAAYRAQFTHQRLVDMVDQIAEKREAQERKRPRGRRK